MLLLLANFKCADKLHKYSKDVFVVKFFQGKRKAAEGGHDDVDDEEHATVESALCTVKCTAKKDQCN